MHAYIRKMQEELAGCGLMPLFEIEVLNVHGEQDWVLCDIHFRGNSLVAQRDAVSEREQRSRKIASTRVVCDSAFGLDDHLQELHEAVVQDILDGDLYELPEY